MASTTITVTVDTVDYVYTLDAVNSDSLRYLGPNSSLVLPEYLTCKRVYPKRQKSFPGVARNELKTTKTISYDDDTTTSPMIWTTSVARRADTDNATLALARKQHAQLLLDGELDGYFTNLSL